MSDDNRMTWDPDKGPTDGQVDNALQVLRAEYWTSIRGIAKDVKSEIDNGNLADVDDVETYVHETVDGCYWVIYTHANYRAIMCSDWDPWQDVEESGQSLTGKECHSQPTALLAYYCVKHDVAEQVEAELGMSVEDYFVEKEEREAEVEEEEESADDKA